VTNASGKDSAATITPDTADDYLLERNVGYAPKRRMIVRTDYVREAIRCAFQLKFVDDRAPVLVLSQSTDDSIASGISSARCSTRYWCAAAEMSRAGMSETFCHCLRS
jgi:hypothetical protein